MKFTDHIIRFLMVTDLDAVRRLTISANAVKIIQGIGQGTTTSSKLAAKEGISIPSASAQLKTLYLKGYLKRKEEKDPTGGIVWVYSTIYTNIN